VGATDNGIEGCHPGIEVSMCLLQMVRCLSQMVTNGAVFVTNGVEAAFFKF
jgi:hypothetical protein